MLLAAISSCHMLWYLHFCSSEGIVVESYTDNAEGKMEITGNESGKFTSVSLSPRIKVKNAENTELAKLLHKKAHEYCVIANSCNIPISYQPTIEVLT